MKVVVISYDPEAPIYFAVSTSALSVLSTSHLIYPRALVWSTFARGTAPCFTCFLHRPCLTSKSLLISLLFLERPIFVFQTLSVWRSLVLALLLFRAVYAFARRDSFHDLTSVLCPLMRRAKSLFLTCYLAIVH